jgi:hypothetical protein
MFRVNTSKYFITLCSVHFLVYEICEVATNALVLLRLIIFAVRHKFLKCTTFNTYYEL